MAKIKQVTSRIKNVFQKYGAMAGVVFLIFLIVCSLTLPKNRFQQAKEQLVQNPLDFQAHLVLAEEFLKNNQFKKAEKELLAAQESGLLAEELWQKKHQSDPEDIQKLVAGWEKIIAEKPGYRDAYLQLAKLCYQIYEDEKAKKYLQKAIELDPNYEPTQELQKIILKN